VQQDADVRPFVTPGMNGACVPSVRESHVKVSFAVPSTRAKGYVDFDVPNDADNQETSVGNSLVSIFLFVGVFPDSSFSRIFATSSLTVWHPGYSPLHHGASP
jgi:hypothetical protein